MLGNVGTSSVSCRIQLFRMKFLQNSHALQKCLTYYRANWNKIQLSYFTLKNFVLITGLTLLSLMLQTYIGDASGAVSIPQVGKGCM